MDIGRLTYLEEPLLWAAVSVDGSHIAFSTYERLYLGQADGRFAELSADGPYLRPSFSPDGRKIVCADGSYYDGLDNRYDISVVDCPTGRKERLTNTGCAADPVFTPSGTRIVFISQDSGARNVSVLDCKTGTVRVLTHDSSRGSRVLSVNEDPAPSVDGRWIYFLSSTHARRREGCPDIYRMQYDGTERQRLTFTNNVGRFLLSPDGSTVAFSTCTTDSASGQPLVDIWLMDADGANQRVVEQATSISLIESFSPDSQWIAFSSSRDRVSRGGRDLCWRIFLLNTRSGEVRRLTDGMSKDTEPRFTSDGRQIVLSSDRDGKGDLYLLNSFS